MAVYIFSELYVLTWKGVWTMIRDELVHGFILVYSTRRKASLATLRWGGIECGGLISSVWSRNDLFRIQQKVPIQPQNALKSINKKNQPTAITSEEHSIVFSVQLKQKISKI